MVYLPLPIIGNKLVYFIKKRKRRKFMSGAWKNEKSLDHVKRKLLRKNIKDLTKQISELKNNLKRKVGELEKITVKKVRSKSYGRTKGLSFEREVANRLKHLFPDVRRQLEFQVQDAKGIDLQNTGCFKIQCKKYAGYVPISIINEVQCNELFGDVPILVTAGTNLEAMVVMKFEHWIEFIKGEN